MLATVDFAVIELLMFEADTAMAEDMGVITVVVAG